MLTYQDVLSSIEHKKSTLLLGNGFSMAYDPHRFSFTHLLEKAVLDGNESKGFKRIYMGVFSEDDKRAAEAFKIEAEQKGKICFLYDATTVHVWR